MLNLKDTKAMLAEENRQTLSIYLDVDLAKQENQAAQPAWRISLKNALTAAAEVMESEGAAIQARVDNFFESYQPKSKGLAVFFTAEDETVHELAVPVESRWSFGAPLLLPLLWALDEYERYLIVRVDQEKAELLSGYLGATTIEASLENDVDEYDFRQKTLMPSTAAVAGGHNLTQGSNREAYDAMINEHIMRFYRDVVSEVESLHKQYPKVRIILSGAEESARAVRELMPKGLEDSIVDVLPIPMRLSESEVLQQAFPAALDYEREHEMSLVQQVLDFAKSGGRGALGHKAVDEALTMQRVELLVLPYPLDDEVEANTLVMRTFAAGGSVELIGGEAADLLRSEGGSAARLYYAL